MRVRAKTAFVTAFGSFSEGDELTVTKDEATGFLKAGLVEVVRDEPETAVSPKPQKAERAVRFGGRA